MGKQSPLTQELANAFPAWSKIRNDPDSNGQRLLNAIANEAEDLAFALQKVDKNTLLSTANLAEIDQLFKIHFDPNFIFTEDNVNTQTVTYVPPTTIEGTIDGVMISSEEDNLVDTSTNPKAAITLIEDGNIKTFWEDSKPDAVSAGKKVPYGGGSEIQSITLQKKIDELYSLETILHPLREVRGAGYFYFTLIAGHPYFRKEEGRLARSRILIKGINRREMEDSEIIVFPWETTVTSKKEWRSITSITPLDILSKTTPVLNCGNTTYEEDSYLKIYADGASKEDYLSLSNTRWSKDRRKIDEFWGTLDVQNRGVLERAEYATQDWKMVMKGNVGKVSKDRWNLKDKSNQDIKEIKDIELIPFKNQCWALVKDANDKEKLCLYDLDKESNDSINELKDLTNNPSIDILIDNEDIVIGETISYHLTHSKFLKNVAGVKVSYSFNGTIAYLSGDDTNYDLVFQKDRILKSVETPILLNTGEYILIGEVIFSDNTTEVIKKIVKSKSKKPLKTFDLEEMGVKVSGEDPSGLFLDSDQKLWIKTNLNYHEINVHKNLALFDYERKIIYLHEKYKDLKVEYP
ncbi:MAG TPA: hypothetical protein QF753_23345 [Victivallales bacterium]|nr:hypothetical protein [Victivallales bacterium]